MEWTGKLSTLRDMKIRFKDDVGARWTGLHPFGSTHLRPPLQGHHRRLPNGGEVISGELVRAFLNLPVVVGFCRYPVPFTDALQGACGVGRVPQTGRTRWVFLQLKRPLSIQRTNEEVDQQLTRYSTAIGKVGRHDPRRSGQSPDRMDGHADPVIMKKPYKARNPLLLIPCFRPMSLTQLYRHP